MESSGSERRARTAAIAGTSGEAFSHVTALEDESRSWQDDTEGPTR